MKKFIVLIGLLLLFAPASSAFDVEDLLDRSGSPGTGLERIQNSILANQNGRLDRFLSGTDSSGGLARSPVQAIIDDFIEKGLAVPTGEDGLQDGTTDDLPFFSGGGTGLFSVPQGDNSGNLVVLEDDDDGDPFAWPDDDWGWFYFPEDSDTWFNSGAWGSGGTQ